MKLLYDDTTGKIFYAIPDKDYFYFRNSTIIPLTEMGIDELAPTNQTLCQDLRKIIGKVDSVGNGKYRVISGELQEKEGWEEGIEDGI